MNAVDEYFDETNKERLPVMHAAKYVDNGGRTLSAWTVEVPYTSSHKIQKQYVNINTGATIPISISVHMNYLDKMELRLGKADIYSDVLTDVPNFNNKHSCTSSMTSASRTSGIVPLTASSTEPRTARHARNWSPSSLPNFYW